MEQARREWDALWCAWFEGGAEGIVAGEHSARGAAHASVRGTACRFDAPVSRRNRRVELFVCD